ncbi:hypothetical protein E2P81_ATG01817 [Venturia nashicola]|uniref:Uncharacterized protein n=1 Tax=Venturia nashicola TaxID=86259 RepID=A0A4Z1PHM2_9PEZI|nr:hypothetical protein E6O75_ATG01864 [Venturia nashicola]TLD35514.1 hypothetical protein E2P81_ATG01817 [Venturia nashicola]
MPTLTSLPPELTLLILENIFSCPQLYEKDVLGNKRHACHHHYLSHPFATPEINAVACRISLTSRRMRDESRGIVQRLKKCLEKEFEEWRNAWILGERGCECLCEEACIWCELPGLVDVNRLEELEGLKHELEACKTLNAGDGAEKARLVRRFIEFWNG